MSWRSGDEGCLRLAIVQLYECGLGTQEGLAEAFGRHVNSVQKYITEFACEGMRGLIAERSGPKSHWKITPELRGKILLIVLREGIWKLEAIQQRLSEAWQEVVSVGSIQQVLEENGLGEQAAREVHGGAVQGELFSLEQEQQLILDLGEDGDKPGEEIAGRTEPQEENGIGKGQSPGGQAGAGDMGEDLVGTIHRRSACVWISGNKEITMRMLGAIVFAVIGALRFSADVEEGDHGYDS
jgi:transposase